MLTAVTVQIWLLYACVTDFNSTEKWQMGTMWHKTLNMQIKIIWHKTENNRNIYIVRKYVCVGKTPTPWRNDKWERCDTKHKTHTFIYQNKIYSVLCSSSPRASECKPLSRVCKLPWLFASFIIYKFILTNIWLTIPRPFMIFTYLLTKSVGPRPFPPNNKMWYQRMDQRRDRQINLGWAG